MVEALFEGIITHQNAVVPLGMFGVRFGDFQAEIVNEFRIFTVASFRFFEVVRIMCFPGKSTLKAIDYHLNPRGHAILANVLETKIKEIKGSHADPN